MASTLASRIASALAPVIGTSTSNLLLTGSASAITIAFQGSLAGTTIGTLGVNFFSLTPTFNGVKSVTASASGDYDGSLYATLVNGPAHASSFMFDANGDGGFTYVPNPTIDPVDTLTFTSVLGGSFAIGVNGRTATNIAWSPTPSTLASNIEQALTNQLNITATVSSSSNPAITFEAQLGGTNPTVTVNGSGLSSGTVSLAETTTGVPAFVGTDTFTYVATDTTGENSNTATVTITVGTTVSIPQAGLSVSGVAGNTVVVPVNIDNPDPAGSAGLASFDLAINFDPNVFFVGQVADPTGDGGSSYSVYNGPDSPYAQFVQGSFDFTDSALAGELDVNVNNTTGEIGISEEGLAETNSYQGNSDGTGGALIDITFTVQANAPTGNTVINLASNNSPTGYGAANTLLSDGTGTQLVLLPAPVNASSNDTQFLDFSSTDPLGTVTGGTFNINYHGQTAQTVSYSTDFGTLQSNLTPALNALVGTGNYSLSGTASAVTIELTGANFVDVSNSVFLTDGTNLTTDTGTAVLAVDPVPVSSASTAAVDDGLVSVLGPPAFIGVTTATSPGAVGVSYGFQYTATGDPTPSFTIISGCCPPA